MCVWYGAPEMACAWALPCACFIMCMGKVGCSEGGAGGVGWGWGVGGGPHKHSMTVQKQSKARWPAAGCWAQRHPSSCFWAAGHAALAAATAGAPPDVVGVPLELHGKPASANVHHVGHGLHRQDEGR